MISLVYHRHHRYFVFSPSDNAVANICQYKIPAVDGFTDVQVVAKKDLINDGDKDLLLSFEPMLGVGVGGPYLSAFEGYHPQTTKVGTGSRRQETNRGG